MRVGIDLFDVFLAGGFRQQVVRHLLQDFSIDLKVRIDEHIQRVVDDALGGVLDRNHAEMRAPTLDLVEDFFDTAHRDVLCRLSEFLNTGEVGEGRPGPEIGNLLRALQRQRGRHDLTIDRSNGFVGKGSAVLANQALDDLGFSAGRMEMGARPGLDLDFSDLDDIVRALVQEAQDFIIDAVDRLPEVLDGLLTGHTGRHPPSARPCQGCSLPGCPCFPSLETYGVEQIIVHKCA